MKVNKNSNTNNNSFDWLNDTDTGYIEDSSISGRVSFPWAQVHNDRGNNGKNGGLFIKREIAPSDISVDESTFKPTVITFEGDGEEKDEAGWLTQHYHLAILAFDNNKDKGNPRCWKDDRGKWCFTILCAIKEAFSTSIPFKITYKGTSAIRMANLVREFDRSIIGRATLLKQQADPTKKVTDVCRHQFWLPVSHTKEKVGYGDKSSYACPVQDLVKETEKSSRTPEGKLSRTGTSVLKAYSDDLNALKSLFIGLDSDGKAKMELFAEWIKEYGRKAVKIFDESGNQVGGSQPSPFMTTSIDVVDFSSNEENTITTKQADFIMNTLVPQTGVDVNNEIQVLRGNNTLIGGDNNSTVFDLSKQGASKLIEHLKSLPKAQSKATAAKTAVSSSEIDELFGEDSLF